MDNIRRPVDISEEFRMSGMTLITDTASDFHLERASQFNQDMRVLLTEDNASTELETPLEEGTEENS